MRFLVWTFSSPLSNIWLCPLLFNVLGWYLVTPQQQEELDCIHLSVLIQKCFGKLQYAVPKQMSLLQIFPFPQIHVRNQKRQTLVFYYRLVYYFSIFQGWNLRALLYGEVWSRSRCSGAFVFEVCQRRAKFQVVPVQHTFLPRPAYFSFIGTDKMCQCLLVRIRHATARIRSINVNEDRLLTLFCAVLLLESKLLTSQNESISSWNRMKIRNRK